MAAKVSGANGAQAKSPKSSILDKGWSRDEMAKLAAEELGDGDYVNLGIGMICSGAGKMAVLGAMEVSQCGDLANWMNPGKMVKSMGGAMDLEAGTPRVVVLTNHVSKDRTPKLVKACETPLTGAKVVKRVVGNLASSDVVDDHQELCRLASGVTLADVEVNTAAAMRGGPGELPCRSSYKFA